MKKAHYILLIAFILSNSTYYAFVYKVPDGTTETTSIVLPNAGDSAIIEEGGAIEVTGGTIGIVMNAASQKVLNQGIILTESGTGINSNNNDFILIVNNGLISTSSTSAHGILNNGGSNAVITNTGLILTQLQGSFGIANGNNSNVVITNTGQILTKAPDSFGITNGTNSNVLITNTGLISTSGNGAVGILNGQNSNIVIINSGQISTLSGNAHGISNSLNGNNIVIKNHGLISVASATGDGIRSEGDNVQIINSGTVRAPSSAINLIGTNQVLTLLKGSNLQGSVTFGTATHLNVETGLHLALTVDGSFGALGIEAPFALSGDNLVAVIDPTGLAMQADMAADLSDAILDSIYLHRIGFPNCTPCGCGVWAQGIGSSRKRSRGDDFVGYDNWQGGFLTGFGIPLWGGNGGLFGGVSFGEAEVDRETQRANTTSYVGGMTYEWFCKDTFIGTALVIGYVDWDNERFVMNNLEAGGVQTAKADTGGGFVTADLTAARHFDALCCTTMSFSLRYAGLFLGNYGEKGSISNLFAKDREVDLITTRFEFSLPWTKSEGDCCWSVEPYAGVYGRYQVGGKHVDAVLLGQSLHFDPGIPHNLAAFLFGFRGVQSIGCFELFLNLEGSFDNYSSSRILGEGGIGLSF
ncbi:MAG: autotransporter domain-containing protein [Chlamydiales bacterium]